LPGLLLDPEDGGCMFFRNVNELQNSTASHPKKQYSSSHGCENLKSNISDIFLRFKLDDNKYTTMIMKMMTRPLSGLNKTKGELAVEYTGVLIILWLFLFHLRVVCSTTKIIFLEWLKEVRTTNS
jgi:hypothetical protein